MVVMVKPYSFRGVGLQLPNIDQGSINGTLVFPQRKYLSDGDKMKKKEILRLGEAFNTALPQM
jgi:hypothetical protein